MRDGGDGRALKDRLPFVGGDPFFLSDYIIRVIHLSKIVTLINGRTTNTVDGAWGIIGGRCA